MTIDPDNHDDRAAIAQALCDWWNNEGWAINDIDHSLPYGDIVNVVLNAAGVRAPHADPPPDPKTAQ